MEKLLNLLNEYDSDWGVTDYWALFNSMNEWISGTEDLQVISKKFWFIKWLVENDKIKPLRKFIGWETDEDEPYIQFDLVDQYIAYLSIQDEPIRFLCEILK